MKTKNGIPLLLRDINKDPDGREDITNSIVGINEDGEASVEKIKARFQKDYLPKYGSLWRRMAREKRGETQSTMLDENYVGISPSNFSVPTVPDQSGRTLNFDEGTEKRDAVDINIAPHGQKCKCDCNSPTEGYFISNCSDQRKENNSKEVSTKELSVQNAKQEKSNPVEDKPNSLGVNTEILTELDKVGVVSVYETAEELGREESDKSDIERTFMRKVSVINDNVDHNQVENDSSDKIGKLEATNTKDNEKKIEESGPTVGANECPRFGTQSFVNTTSNPSKGIVIYDLCGEDEDDDERDAEIESVDGDSSEDDAEWIPDSDSLQQTLRVNSVTTNQVENRRVSATIDLCDSSGDETDFTLSDEDEEEQFVALRIEEQRSRVKSKAAFRRHRDRILKNAFNEFNQNAFGGKLGKVEVRWSNKLNTTAGLTRLKKISVDMTPGLPLKRHAVIELSTKVVDEEEKLRSTLLHELVHAAVWILDGVSKPPHGADFKRWAKIAMSKIPDVIVTTTHDYVIQYKFNWKCVNRSCTFTVGRHSRSVDVIRHRCGLCKSELIETTPDGVPKKRAQPSAYNLFVKEHSKTVREQLIKIKPSTTQAEVMKELGRLWREKKIQSKDKP